MENTPDFGWVKSAFLLSYNETIDNDGMGMLSRIYSTSMQKATDTTLGGNFYLNPLPQFTRYADLKHNILSSAHGRGNNILIPSYSRNSTTTDQTSNGMGRTYSEKFDDNTQVVHFRVGYPKFNSLSSFYANYYSVPAASLARTGRSPGFFYELGWAIGSVATIPMLPIMMVSKVIKFFLRKPSSKYYSLKPAMYPYWSAVSSMVNGIAANKGVIPRPIYSGTKHLYERESGIAEGDGDLVSAFHKMMPSIYRESGGIDVFAVGQRGQRLVNARRDLLDNELNGLETREAVRKAFQKRLYGGDIKEAFRNASAANATLETYSKIWAEAEIMGYIPETLTEDGLSNNSLEAESDQRLQSDGFVDRASAAFDSERRMGSDFVSFRIDHTGTQSESFSNSTKEPTIKQDINGLAAAARETRFSIMDGNIDSSGFVGKAYSAIKDVVSGASAAIGFDGLAQLSGNAYVDIPKVWDSSSADFNKLSITIPLRSPYNDPISHLQNIILPMCALFAMAVPLATGKQSHTSPFLIEYFAPGRAHSRLAIVESLSFTRGVGDVGWSNTGTYLGVDVQMTLLDLSDAINMHLNPVHTLTEEVVQAAGYGIGEVAENTISWLGETDIGGGGELGVAGISALLGSTYDDDNSYTDYLAILGSIPLEAEINTARKWAIRLAKQQAKFDDTKSPERMVMWSMSGTFGEVLKAGSQATDRQ